MTTAVLERSADYAIPPTGQELAVRAAESILTVPKSQPRIPAAGGPFRYPTLLSFRGDIEAGKTTAANFVVERNLFATKRISFAEPLKVEVYNALSAYRNIHPMGRTDYEEALVSDLCNITQRLGLEAGNLCTIAQIGSEQDDRTKVAIINTHKATLRKLLQYWGSEFRRAEAPEYQGRPDCYNDYWVDKYRSKVDSILQQGIHVVTDDARFGNERDAIKGLGGYEIFIINPYLQRDERALHISEKLADPTDPAIDFLIANQRPLDKFKRTVDGLIFQISQVAQ